MRDHARRSIAAVAAAALLAGAGCKESKDEAVARPAPPASSALARPAGFEVTGGTPQAHRHFATGLRALHSFWYDEATREFQAAIDADSSFAMAYWGLAMSMSQLLWGDDKTREARAILERLPRPYRLSERERAWIDAARALFGEETALAGRRRFAAAMENLHRRFPDDESATFLSIALQATLTPRHPDEAAIRARAGALAAEVLARNPNHPGAAHYLIHAYDTPALAAKALPAARRYAAIAPEAFHAQHMPAHIFARLGMWKEALASCQAAWDASIAAARRHELGPDHHDFHSLTWLVEINFELGRRSQADAAFAIYAEAVKVGLGTRNRITYVSQVASYLTRTGEWRRVDELLAPLDAASADPAAPAVAPPAEGAPGACHAAAPAPAGSPMGMLEKRAILSVRARAAAARHDLAGLRGLLDRIQKIDRELHPVLVRSQSPELVAMQDEVNELFDPGTAGTRAARSARPPGDPARARDGRPLAAGRGDAGRLHPPRGDRRHAPGDWRCRRRARRLRGGGARVPGPRPRDARRGALGEEVGRQRKRARVVRQARRAVERGGPDHGGTRGGARGGPLSPPTQEEARARPPRSSTTRSRSQRCAPPGSMPSSAASTPSPSATRRIPVRHVGPRRPALRRARPVGRRPPALRQFDSPTRPGSRSPPRRRPAPRAAATA